MKTRSALLPLGARLRSIKEALVQTLRLLLQPAFDHGVAGSWLLRLHRDGTADAAEGYGHTKDANPDRTMRGHDHHSLESGASALSPMMPLGLSMSQHAMATTCMAAKTRRARSQPRHSTTRGMN